MKVFDYKTKMKELYCPGAQPEIVSVPQIQFLSVEGAGDPNTSPDYKAAIEMLYGVSYNIKMWKIPLTKPQGFFDYVVPPLEGLWEGAAGTKIENKEKLHWNSLIRLPEFVTEEMVAEAKAALPRKKRQLPVEKVKRIILEEGLCVQMMHTGSFDMEWETIGQKQDYCKKSGYEEDFASGRLHHEIYLSDPRKSKPENMKTVIRHPIRKR